MEQITGDMRPGSIRPLWQETPPQGVDGMRWVEIRRAAVKYRPRARLDFEEWMVWREFALAALAASQPRRMNSVGNRLGSFAHHIAFNRPDFTATTVGDVFSDRALRVTLLRSQALGLSASGCAHVKRNISAMRRGLLGDPLKFIHIANQPSSDVCALEIVKWISAHGRERERVMCEDIYRWFHHENIHEPFPKNIAVSLSVWCVENGFTYPLVQRLRAEHASKWARENIPPIVVLTLPSINPAFIHVTPVDAIVTRKALRGLDNSWNMNLPTIALSRGNTKGNNMEAQTVGPVQGQLSRAAIRREVAKREQGINGGVALLPPNLEHILDTIRLKVVSPSEWESIRPVVQSIMRRAHIRGEVSFKKIVRVIAAYAVWAQRNGYEPTIDVLMSESVIETWVKAGLSHERASTLNSYRGFVRRVASNVNPSFTAPVKAPRMARQSVRPPYTGPEIRRITELSRSVENPSYRGQSMAAIALGFGAGLDSSDLSVFRVEDVTDHGVEGIHVRVTAGRVREVWLMRIFEPLMREALRLLPPTGVLVCPERRRRSGPVSELYGKIHQIGNYPVPIDQARMRSTWLCVLLNAPIPLGALLTAAGLKTPTTLTDLVQFATNTHPTDMKSILQGA